MVVKGVNKNSPGVLWLKDPRAVGFVGCFVLLLLHAGWSAILECLMRIQRFVISTVK